MAVSKKTTAKRGAATKAPPKAAAEKAKKKEAAAASREDETYEVEKIIDKRESPSEGLMYYVKWKNYPSNSNTWEPVDELKHTTLVDEFEAKLAKQQAKSAVAATASRAAKAKASSKEAVMMMMEADDDEEKTEAGDEDKEQVDQEEMEAQEVADKKATTKRPRTTRVLTETKKKKLVTPKLVTPKTKAAPTRKAPARGGKKAAKVEEEEEAEVDVEVDEVEEEAAKTNTFLRDDSNGTEVVPEEEEEEKAEYEFQEKQETAVIEFNKFKPTRLINESLESKFITFVGDYKGQQAVIRLDKMVFDEGSVKKALVDKELESERSFINDIYSSYMMNTHSKTVNSIKATVVWPATESVLAKYSRAEKIFYNEPPEVYANVVEPYISSKVKSKEDPNRWVYNILEGKSEQDRVVMNDPNPDSGFVLVPDLKQAASDKEVILLAICHRRDIRSLRDLHDKHLTMLRNILTKGTQVIKDKYKKTKNELRAYVHYHPSFYHFHVHFKLVDPADYWATDRDHLLSTVINNISLNKLYYKKATLTYPLSISSELYENLKEADRL